MNYKPALKLILSIFAVSVFSISANAQNCKQHQALIDKMDKAMVDKDVTLLAEIYHENAVRHYPEGTAEGIKKIQEVAAQFYQQVPDAAEENLDFICSDDRIVVRWKGSGTPAGTGKKVSVTGINIYKVKDNKVVEEWQEMNSLSLMMQIGFELKPPEGAGAGDNK